MIRPLFLVFLGLQSLQAQSPELQRVERGIADVRDSLEAIRSKVESDLKPQCSAEVKWQPGDSAQVAGPQSSVNINLFSVVSQPRDSCLNAEIRITANFYMSGEFVCSGTLALAQNDVVQNTYLEVRPFYMEQFLKWRDAQTWEQSSYHSMPCFDREGIEVRDPANYATLLKLFAIVLPKSGGLASSEFQITLPRPANTTQRPASRLGPPAFR